uniref:Uncharacterized protein n=1 Tax=Romanomermis culicivorax TaxID=13658 RepID=A0A915I0W8_ROMCU
MPKRKTHSEIRMIMGEDLYKILPFRLSRIFIDLYRYTIDRSTTVKGGARQIYERTKSKCKSINESAENEQDNLPDEDVVDIFISLAMSVCIWRIFSASSCISLNFAFMMSKLYAASISSSPSPPASISSLICYDDTNTLFEENSTYSGQIQWKNFALSAHEIIL